MVNKITNLGGLSLICFALALLYGCGTTPITPSIAPQDNPNGAGANYGPPNEDWSLSWSDEFNGSAIDSSIWTHEMGQHGWGNNELQNYTDSSNNSYIEAGKLVIKAIRAGNTYTSARMISENKFRLNTDWW